MIRNWKGMLPLGPPCAGADELVTSFVDRAAALHGVSRGDVLMSITEGRAGQASQEWDWDVLIPQEWCRRLEEAAALPVGDLRPAPVSLRPLMLKPALRRAYCPLCFQEDLRAGRLPHFRIEWTRVAVTHCAEHHCPLCLWGVPADGKGPRVYPEAWLDQVAGVLDCDPTDEEVRGIALRNRLSEKRRIGGPEWLGQDLSTARAFCLAAAGPAGATPYQVHLERARWAGLVDFEREAAGLAPAELSILKSLEPGLFHDFVGDLYSLATTRFSTFLEPAIRLGSAEGDGLGHSALFFRWRRALTADKRLWDGGIEDWRAEGQPEIRRTVLAFVKTVLEEHAGQRRRWLSDAAEGTALTSILQRLDGDAFAWLTGRARGWPEPVRGDALRCLKRLESVRWPAAAAVHDLGEPAQRAKARHQVNRLAAKPRGDPE